MRVMQLLWIIWTPMLGLAFLVCQELNHQRYENTHL
jgi:hypothetical protein